MKKRILFALVSAGLVTGQAQAHQLAYSKAEQVSVNVPGEASNWCQPAVELTLERPTWDSREPLDRLLSKIPFVLSQECAKAKFTWKAVDAKGQLYASGEGTAKSLGVVNLAAPVNAPVAVTPQATTEVAEQTAQTVVPAQAAQTKAPVEAVAQVSPAPEAPAATAPAQQVAVLAEQAPAQVAAPEASKKPVEIAQATQSVGEMGRKLVQAHDYYAEVVDQNGCKWMVSAQEVHLNPANFNIVSEGASCVDGYAQGEFKSARLMQNDGRRGNYLENGYVHPSGIILKAKVGKYIEKLPLAFIKADASQVVFQAGDLTEPSVKVHLAFQRNNTGSVFYAYSSSPYYVGLTADESFAYEPSKVEQVATQIRALALTHYRGEDPAGNVFVTKDLPALYPVGYGQFGSDHMVFTANVNETRFLLVKNHALQRKQERERAEMANLEMEAELNERMLRDYEQGVARQKESGMTEAEYAAKQSGYIFQVPSPIDLMNPKKSNRYYKMVANIEGQEGDYYITTYPGKIRLSSSVELANGWQILGVVNTTMIDKGDEKFITPTFMVVPNVEEPTPCEQEKCADKLNIAKMVANGWKRDSSTQYDWDGWTPEVAREKVQRFEQLKAAQESQ